jgi:hypothetical protein
MADQTQATWEPGAPGWRTMLPSVIGGAVVPLAVYYAVRRHVSGDTPALIIAGAFPAAWVAIQWVRQRRIDPIGAITLFGFAAGVIASTLLGGSAFVLKVRDSAFTALFGLTCALSLLARRPLMFHLGKGLAAGGDPMRRAAYDELWEFPEAQRVFRTLTAVWSVGLLGEAALRVVLAAALPTGPFLAVSPVVGFGTFAALFTFTLRYSRRARERGEPELAAQGVSFPSVPLADSPASTTTASEP